MSAKFTILLVSLVPLGHAPIAIYGADGRPVGHARYDEELGSHALRIPYDDWKNGVGKAVIEHNSLPVPQWLPLVEVEEAAKGEPQGSGFAPGGSAEAGADANDLTHFDDINAGFLRCIQEGKLAHLEEEKTEEKDGQFFKVKRELVPAVRQEGNNTVPEGTTIIPVNAFVSIKETREAIAKPDDTASTFVEDTKKAIGGVESELVPETAATANGTQKTPESDNAATLAPFAARENQSQPAVDPVESRVAGTVEPQEGQPVPDAPKSEEDTLAQVQSGERINNPDDVRVQLTSAVSEVKEGEKDSSEEAKAQADPDANEKGGETDSELKTIAKGAGGFRRLRAIAKTEGVADFEKITKADDMIAAIELHREGQTNATNDQASA